MFVKLCDCVSVIFITITQSLNLTIIYFPNPQIFFTKSLFSTSQIFFGFIFSIKYPKFKLYSEWGIYDYIQPLGTNFGHRNTAFQSRDRFQQKFRVTALESRVTISLQLISPFFQIKNYDFRENTIWSQLKFRKIRKPEIINFGN